MPHALGRQLGGHMGPGTHNPRTFSQEREEKFLVDPLERPEKFTSDIPKRGDDASSAPESLY